MKSFRSIIAAGMLAILAVITITFVSPAYSHGSDPKCAECTKTTCDESCSSVCTDADRQNCTVKVSDTGNNPTTSGKSSKSEVMPEVKDNSCTNCTQTSCSMMDSPTVKSNK